jgi:hypothetical protein
MGIKMKDNKISALLKWTRILFFLNAVVWLGLGILSLSFRALDDGSLVQWVITVLMLINGLVMICFGIMIISGGSLVFTLAILYMSLNVVLSITDQFGWVDALILFLNLCLLGSLFVTRHSMNRIIEVISRES